MDAIAFHPQSVPYPGPQLVEVGLGVEVIVGVKVTVGLGMKVVVIVWVGVETGVNVTQDVINAWLAFSTP
jgi:hypothetical protein